MFKKYFSFILGVLLLLMASSPALAKPKESKDRGESKDHKIFTTYNWVEEKIEESLSSLQLLYQSLVTRLDDLDEMLAGLFDKNDQQDQYVVQLEEQVSNLEDRVSSLESSPIPLPTPTPIPAPEGITIQFSVDRPQPFNSEWVDVTGYNTIFINASSSEWLHIYGIHYTDDPAMATDTTGFIEQARVDCADTCPETMLPVMGQYYRFSTGLSSGLITATGRLEI